METPPAFDSSIYPRVYKAARKPLIMVFMIMSCMPFLPTYFLFCMHNDGNVFVIPCISPFILIFAIGNIFFARITLYSDRIAYKSWFSKREMLRKNVARVGFIPGRGINIPCLRNKDENKKPFRIFTPSVRDDAWKAWMSFH
jgi:hypothetical protein